jgi:hypothetical protein
VEHRWFPATPECGILGGIVAPSYDAAMGWARAELYSERQGFDLVRVRMEYEIPPKKPLPRKRLLNSGE